MHLLFGIPHSVWANLECLGWEWANRSISKSYEQGCLFICPLEPQFAQHGLLSANVIEHFVNDSKLFFWASFLPVVCENLVIHTNSIDWHITSQNELSKCTSNCDNVSSFLDAWNYFFCCTPHSQGWSFSNNCTMGIADWLSYEETCHSKLTVKGKTSARWHSSELELPLALTLSGIRCNPEASVWCPRCATEVAMNWYFFFLTQSPDVSKCLRTFSNVLIPLQLHLSWGYHPSLPLLQTTLATDCPLHFGKSLE